MKRNRAGNRRYRATFKRHDGTLDGHGQPTYSTEADWDIVVSGYPCSWSTARGSEMMRRGQVQPETTHVIQGEYFGVKDIVPSDKCLIDGIEYGIEAVYDEENLRREMTIELKRHI